MNARITLRRTAYWSGGLGLARKAKRKSLTALMFHRVLDPSDPDFKQADPVWALSTPLFAAFLEFVCDNYAVVSLDQVMAARDGKTALPDHALIITFDDGWSDNLRYAAPLLKARALPAVIFAVPDAVQSPALLWWHEHVFASERNGALKSWLAQDAVKHALKPAVGEEADALVVVTRLARLDEEERSRLLRLLPALPRRSRMMLSPDDLPKLADYGIAVGIHGFSHVPLTEIDDVESELRQARAAVDALAGAAARSDALGCPHGRYNARVIEAARNAGLKLLFTSDQYLNRTADGALEPNRPLGRINVSAAAITDDTGRFDPSAAARWLWARDVA